MTAKQRAGLRNQANGHKFEIFCWNKIKHAQCLERWISSGSKGMFDVGCVQVNGKVRLISCKRNGYLTPKEKREMAGFMVRKPKNVQVELWYRPSMKTFSKRIFKTAEQVMAW